MDSIDNINIDWNNFQELKLILYSIDFNGNEKLSYDELYKQFPRLVTHNFTSLDIQQIFTILQNDVCEVTREDINYFVLEVESSLGGKKSAPRRDEKVDMQIVNDTLNTIYHKIDEMRGLKLSKDGHVILNIINKLLTDVSACVCGYHAHIDRLSSTVADLQQDVDSLHASAQMFEFSVIDVNNQLIEEQNKGLLLLEKIAHLERLAKDYQKMAEAERDRNSDLSDLLIKMHLFEKDNLDLRRKLSGVLDASRDVAFADCSTMTDEDFAFGDELDINSLIGRKQTFQHRCTMTEAARLSMHIYHVFDHHAIPAIRVPPLICDSKADTAYLPNQHYKMKKIRAIIHDQKLKVMKQSMLDLSLNNASLLDVKINKSLIEMPASHDSRMKRDKKHLLNSFFEKKASATKPESPIDFSKDYLDLLKHQEIGQYMSLHGMRCDRIYSDSIFLYSTASSKQRYILLITYQQLLVLSTGRLKIKFAFSIEDIAKLVLPKDSATLLSVSTQTASLVIESFKRFEVIRFLHQICGERGLSKISVNEDRVHLLMHSEMQVSDTLQGVYKVSTCKGYLQTWGKKAWRLSGEWMEKFFILCNIGIIIFDKPDSLSPTGFIPIIGSAVLGDPKHLFEKENVFKIIYADGKTEICLAARSHIEKLQWIDSMHKVMDQQHK